MFTKICLLVLTLVFLAGCSPNPEALQLIPPAEQGLQGTAAVPIDPALKVAFEGLLIALFTAGFVYLFEKFGLDLRQYAIPLAGTISTFLVALAQGWIDGLPIEYDPYVLLIMRVLLALLGSFGALRLFSRQPATLIEHSANRPLR